MSEKQVIPYSDPYYLGSSDNSINPLSSIIFNGNNYLPWSRSVKMALGAKNKLGFIDGNITKPAPDSQDYSRWVRNDYMLRCWLFASVTPEIADVLILSESAKGFWDDLVERYGQPSAPQLYSIKKEVTGLMQNEMSVAEYYGKLKRSWDELNSLDGFPECSCGALQNCSCKYLKRILERESQSRLIDFLMGLNSSKYDGLRGNILAMDPVPTINKAFQLVQQAEKQKQVTENIESGFDASALFANKGTLQNVKGVFPRRETKEEKMRKYFCEHCKMKGHTKEGCFKLNGYPYCDHCNMKGHNKEGCFKIHGYPDRSKNVLHKGKRNISYAANVEGKEDNKSQEEPLDFGNQRDNNMVNSLVEQVLKALSIRQNEASSSSVSNSNLSNFAGIIPSNNAQSSYQSLDKYTWIVDSGASEHMVNTDEYFFEKRKLNKIVHVGMPDGSVRQVKETGSVYLGPKLILRNVLYIPAFKHNLLSVARIIQQNKLKVMFSDEKCVFQDPSSDEVVGTGRRNGGVYQLELSEGSCKRNESKKIRSFNECNNVALNKRQTQNILLFHQRLGHTSLSKMKHISHCGCNGLNELFCDTCCLAKHHRLPFPVSKSIAASIFDLVHIDLWGPYRVQTITSGRYFLTILDDHSRVTWTFLINNKEQVKTVLHNFIAYVQNQFNVNIKVIRTDNGTEIVQGECGKMLADKGIFHQRSAPRTPQQNGRVERKHRHLAETARAMKIHAGLPSKFWGECILAATYIINLLPSSVLNWETPFERLMKKPPDYTSLRTMGCLCYATNSHTRGDKFAPKAKRCIMLGYPNGQKAYRVYDLEDHKILICRDVVFKEDQFPFRESGTQKPGSYFPQQHFPTDDPVDEHDEYLIEDAGDEGLPQPDHTTEHSVQPATQSIHTEAVGSSPRLVTAPLRRSEREKRLPAKLDDYITSFPPVRVTNTTEADVNLSGANFVMTQLEDKDYYSPEYVASLNNVLKTKEPTTFHEASQDVRWCRAMQEELAALEKNGTWELTSLPEGKKALDSKWVYKVKFKPNGEVERYKARLVARGDRQVKGKDYKATFSPVAKFATVRTMIALATKRGWKLHQLDINNAFLHGHLEEEVYLKIPTGYTTPHTPGQVCRLKKSLYGLKQASRQWNIELRGFLKHLGYHQCARDSSVFFKPTGTKLSIALVYVDDLLLTGDDEEGLQHLKMSLDKAFTIKDLGELRYFLGIEVARSVKGTVINQRKYIQDLISDTGFHNCSPTSFPFPKGVKLSTDEGEPLDNPEVYRSLIGRLLYLNLSRPDITFSVQQLSQFMSFPRKPHLQAAFHVLKYLKGTANYGLFYPKDGGEDFVAYSDADWGSCPFSGRSLTGYCIFIGGCLVSWKTKKQRVTSKSSCEAELRSMSMTTAEVAWLTGLFEDILQPISLPVTLCCDNISAEYIAHNEVFHERTKHLKLDCYYIRENIEAGLIHTTHVKSALQLAMYVITLTY